MTLILYAVPAFFVLIAVELFLDKIKGTHYYRVNDAISSLSAGVLSRMTAIVQQLIPITFYLWVYKHFAITNLPDSALMWLLAFVLYDFFYYWNHRLGHEISLLWAAHVVHHSSEEYNLTTALRQTSGDVLSWVFYLPMAVLGFPPQMVITVAALNLIYQFWIHTRHIGQLGWFEWLFVSPSHHRVHHAQNSCYIDRNYGGVFIIWDRLFATFQQELQAQPPIYGIRKALHSWNPIWANLQVYAQLCHDSLRTRRWRDKLRIWLGPTGWRPEDVTNAYPLATANLATFQKYDLPLSPITRCYALLQHALTVMLALILMLYQQNLTMGQQLQVLLAVVVSSLFLGWLMERKSLALWLELGKNVALLVMLFMLPLPTWITSTLLISTIITSILLRWVAKDLTA